MVFFSTAMVFVSYGFVLVQVQVQVLSPVLRKVTEVLRVGLLCFCAQEVYGKTAED
jgi:hypothetical protein